MDKAYDRAIEEIEFEMQRELTETERYVALQAFYKGVHHGMKRTEQIAINALFGDKNDLD